MKFDHIKRMITLTSYNIKRLSLYLTNILWNISIKGPLDQGTYGAIQIIRDILGGTTQCHIDFIFSLKHCF